MLNARNPCCLSISLLCRRLLSTDPEAAKEVVLAEKPVIADTSSNLEPALLDVLLANLSTLSSVYHKPPEVVTFTAASPYVLHFALSALEHLSLLMVVEQERLCVYCVHCWKDIVQHAAHLHLGMCDHDTCINSCYDACCHA